MSAASAGQRNEHRKRTGIGGPQQALEEQEIRYRSLFEGVPIELYATAPEGLILNAK